MKLQRFNVCCSRLTTLRRCSVCGLMARLFIIVTALLWGDPHIITIDQHRYTFNGIGDYVLLRIGPANNAEFEIQGRMEPVVGGNATIYTGFAISVRDGMKYAIVFDRHTNGINN